MDPRLLDYYNRELHHLREMGGEFARQFPKIAGRLGLDEFECADPYVERLLEGFAYLAARVQLKIDSEFPHFTNHLLEAVYPHYLAPLPSMAVVRFQPALNEGDLADGFPLPRGTVLRSLLGPEDQTPCEYRTAHDVVLWPLQLTHAEYFSRDVPTIPLPSIPDVRAAIRLTFRTTAGLTFNKLALDRLPLFLHSGDETAALLYEQIFANALAVVAQPADGQWRQVLDRSHIRRVGFDDQQALLPYGPRSFHGYRLLQEYFALPQRFLFLEIGGLAGAVRRVKDDRLDVVIPLDRLERGLENRVDASHFALFCSPAVNLFPRRADRIHLTQHSEHHVVPDRVRPMDFEVHSVTEVVGIGSLPEREQPFLPFYALTDSDDGNQRHGYFVTHRRPRMASSRQLNEGPRSSYLGSEVFLSLVDAREAPYRHDLRQLAVTLECTNRDLPLLISVGQTDTDFTLTTSAPVEAVRCVAGPTPPQPSVAYQEGASAWRAISHLSLNYLSLADGDRSQGAAAFRQLLELYGDLGEAATRKQIAGLRSVQSRPIVRRLPVTGPIAYGRGLEVSVTFDDSAFEGSGIFLLGAVLEHFFAKYVSLNSFTETVIHTQERGQIIRWPARIGRRHTL